jgi:phosphohistidine phosphatase
MRLYFLRHADALEGLDDAARALSPKGRQQCRELARFLEDAGIQFDAAYSSPLVRARQTAEIILGICGGLTPDELRVTDNLLNETSPKQFEGWLRTLPELDHILLVGHAPSLPQRVRALLSIGDAEALKLPKGGLACLETKDGRSATLKFFVSPKVLGT